ncbi:MAG: hypothetical protein KIS76_09980 [Pyrinomonadaceae bacterium]|nr:hypothetical protein [Pyrinomonadaceae bacterium]
MKISEKIRLLGISLVVLGVLQIAPLITAVPALQYFGSLTYSDGRQATDRSASDVVTETMKVTQGQRFGKAVETTYSLFFWRLVFTVVASLLFIIAGIGVLIPFRGALFLGIAASIFAIFFDLAGIAIGIFGIWLLTSRKKNSHFNLQTKHSPSVLEDGNNDLSII